LHTIAKKPAGAGDGYQQLNIQNVTKKVVSSKIELMGPIKRMNRLISPLFQIGWFVESLMTQTLITPVIRTNKIPFLQSRAVWALTATTVSIMAFGVGPPYSPLASALGLTHLPRLYWPILMLTLHSYMGLTQIVKVWLLRRHWI